jgi:hypothetical protein
MNRYARASLALLAASLVVSMPVPVGAQSPSTPSSSPIATPAYPPPPGTTTAPGGLAWRPVPLDLREDRWLSQLTVWSGGLVALEKDEDDRAYATWTSPDGVGWARSRLPSALRGATRLVDLRAALYLFVPMSDGDSTRLRMRIWRSSDGTDWRPAGWFRWRIAARHRGVWRVGFAHIAAAPDRLVLFVAIDACCGTGGGIPTASRSASLAEVSRTRVPHEGVAIWTSRTGRHWVRRSNEAFREDTGVAWVTDVRQTPDGLLATRMGAGSSLLASTDGIRWVSRGSLPSQYTWSGSEGLLQVDGSVMVVSDDEGPGGRAMGNRLGAWLSEPDGSWTRVLDLQAAVSHAQVAVARTVIVVGRSWDGPATDWPWLLVSLDGGRSWDPGLSWSGARGGCLGDIVALARRVVMRDCSDSPPGLWVTDLPVSALTPPASPNP